MTTSVTLHPMTEPEFEQLATRLAAGFAADSGSAHGLDDAEALEVARAKIEKLAPEGPGSAEQLIWTARDADVVVGTLWIGVQGPVPFVYNVEVLAEHRGRGYGRAIMLAGEDACRQLGHQQLDLNVFGDNATAIGLYTSLGYAVVSQQMRKEL